MTHDPSDDPTFSRKMLLTLLVDCVSTLFINLSWELYIYTGLGETMNLQQSVIKKINYCTGT